MEHRDTFRRSNHPSPGNRIASMTFSPTHDRNTPFVLRHETSHDLHAGDGMNTLFLLGKVTVCLLQTASRGIASQSQLRWLPATASRHGLMASPEIPQQTGPAAFHGGSLLTSDPACTKQEVLHAIQSSSCLGSHVARYLHPGRWMRRQQQHEGTCERHTHVKRTLHR